MALGRLRALVVWRRTTRPGRRARPRASPVRPRRPRSRASMQLRPCPGPAAGRSRPPSRGRGRAGPPWPRSPADLSSASLPPVASALLANPQVLGPAADVAVQGPVLERDRARFPPRRAARDRARPAAASPGTRRAPPRAPRGSRGRGGWWARRGSARWRPTARASASESRRRSPPDRPSSGFSASSPENRKRPSSARALFGVSVVARCVGLEHGARAGAGGELLGVLGQVADLDVVTGAELAAAAAPARPPASRSASSCRRRWGRRATRARRARATARRPASSCLPPTSRSPSISSKTTRPLRSGGLKANVSAAPSARIAR